MDFAALDLQTKKAKVQALLATIKDTDPIFAQLDSFVHTIPTISDEVLTYIYTSIMDIGTALQNKNTELAQSTFVQLQDKLKSIEAAEQNQMKQEGSPDDLLKNI